MSLPRPKYSRRLHDIQQLECVHCYLITLDGLRSHGTSCLAVERTVEFQNLLLIFFLLVLLLGFVSPFFEPTFAQVNLVCLTAGSFPGFVLRTVVTSHATVTTGFEPRWKTVFLVVLGSSDLQLISCLSRLGLPVLGNSKTRLLCLKQLVNLTTLSSEALEALLEQLERKKTKGHIVQHSRG